MKIKKLLIIALVIIGGIALSSCNMSVPCPAYADAEQIEDINLPS